MTSTSTALGQALTTIITGLRLALRLAATRVPALAPLLLLTIHNRLGRMVLRLDRLALQWQAGTLPKPRPARPQAAEPRPQSPQRPYIPAGQAWLIRLAQPAVHSIYPVELFLARPDTQAFLQAVPQAGRLLRPLCRMLGITPPAILQRPRPRPAPPRPVRPRAPCREPRTYQAFLATLAPPPAPAGPDFYASHIFRT